MDYIVRRENGNGKGANIFDPHRLVLYVNSDLSDWRGLLSGKRGTSRKRR